MKVQIKILGGKYIPSHLWFVEVLPQDEKNMQEIISDLSLSLSQKQ
jgi:hypothetical protein